MKKHRSDTYDAFIVGLGGIAVLFFFNGIKHCMNNKLAIGFTIVIISFTIFLIYKIWGP